MVCVIFILKYIFSKDNLAKDEIQKFIELVECFQPLKVFLTMDFLTALDNQSKIIEDTYRQILNVMNETKYILLNKGFVVEFASYDKDTGKMYYPKDQKGDERFS